MKKLYTLLAVLLVLIGVHGFPPSCHDLFFNEAHAIPPTPLFRLPSCSDGQVVVYNSTTGKWDTCASLGRAVAYSTSSTITCFTSVLADTSGGAITITLPADPTEGCQIAIIDAAGTFATYNLTVERNSQKINGLSENLTLTVNNLHVGLVYYNATYGWRVLTY